MSALDALREAFQAWYGMLRSSLDAVPIYTQFTSACYKALIESGVPSAEATVISTELLKIHLATFLCTREPESDVYTRILQQSNPRQEH